MDYHHQLVQQGRYMEARKILSFLNSHVIFLALDDIEEKYLLLELKRFGCETETMALVFLEPTQR